MKIAKQTPTILTVKSNKHLRLLVFGIAIFALGLLAIIVVRVQPLRQSDLQVSKLFYFQQESADSFNPDTQTPSLAATGFRLTYYTGRLIFTRERPVVVLALVGLIAGLLILIGPFRGQVVTFDKSRQQVELKRSLWFFRSHVEIYPFRQISEVSVERERASTKSERNFGVILSISHSEGAPLSRNYVHYKTVHPVSQSFRYDYNRAKTMAERIQTFLAEA